MRSTISRYSARVAALGAYALLGPSRHTSGARCRVLSSRAVAFWLVATAKTLAVGLGIDVHRCFPQTRDGRYFEHATFVEFTGRG